jgi:hypothetical protein
MTGPKINPRVRMYGKVCLGDCGRVTRKEGTSLADFPDTISHNRGGRCSSCHRRLMGTATRHLGPREYVHAELSVYTPEQTKRVTALFGRDVEIMRMLGMVA